jgi:hypothetical protein
MKIIPYNQLLLRIFDVPVLLYQHNYDIEPSKALPISDNLDLKVFLQVNQDNPKEIKVSILLQTLEKGKSELDFTALCSAFFHSQIPFPVESGELTKEQKKLLLTALSTTYSTFRGFLLCKLPIKIDRAGTENPVSIIPLLSLDKLLEALKEGNSEAISIQEMKKKNTK